MEIPIKVRKFSRSKTEIKEETPTVTEVPSVKRGRKPKIKTINTDFTPPSLEEEQEEDVSRLEDDFLKDLNNGIFQKEELKVQEEEKKTKVVTKEISKKETVKPMFWDDLQENLFINKKGEKPTPIIGKNNRQLLTKIHQYKELFPDELKSFKLPKNPSTEQLKEALQECENIVECGTLDGFLTDSVLSCLKVVETVSTHTEKFNVSGMTAMLKNNPQFHKLCRLLYIKYHVFSNVPPEYQMVLLVATTAMICNQKNKNKGGLDQFLNEKI
jgi:hypothetical protein